MAERSALALIRLLLLLAAAGGCPAFAQDSQPLRTKAERERALKVEFEAALASDPDKARRLLPLIADRPWIRELSFHDACALARAAAGPEEAALAEKLVLASGLENPPLALRQSEEYISGASGLRLFEQFVLAAPDEAVAMASGDTRFAREYRDRISGAGSPEMRLVARIAAEESLDLPRRSRLAVLVRAISAGALTYDAAVKISGSEPRFFATVLDMRTAAPAPALDRALENQSLMLCRAAQENLGRIVGSDLAQFRTRDLYALLSLGRAEATPAVFSAVFDRLLLPKWKLETPKARSLVGFLDQTNNWELRDFAAGALAARRFDALLSIAGSQIVGRLVRGVDAAADPLREGIRLVEIVGATAAPTLLEQMRSLVSGEFARCRDSGDLRGATIYGLLAARLSLDPIAAPYTPFFRSSEILDTALLFGSENDCIERHFFYDDDDGVESFQSFRAAYERDPAWHIEDRGDYVHLTGRGIDGRRIEIYANVPIDTHLPKNRALEGAAQRRQQAIDGVLKQRGIEPAVIVHRGHSFWTKSTLTYIGKPARLVILGSCGGAGELHAVIEASHDAQVIATRGVGTTEINDSILKAINDRLLTGERIIHWTAFWQELKVRWGASVLFRDYLAPNQDAGAVFLRAYYRFLDSLQ